MFSFNVLLDNKGIYIVNGIIPMQGVILGTIFFSLTWPSLTYCIRFYLKRLNTGTQSFIRSPWDQTCFGFQNGSIYVPYVDDFKLVES